MLTEILKYSIKNILTKYVLVLLNKLQESDSLLSKNRIVLNPVEGNESTKVAILKHIAIEQTLRTRQLTTV